MLASKLNEDFKLFFQLLLPKQRTPYNFAVTAATQTSMNSTSDSASGPSGDLDGSYAYSSIGSYFAVLAVITLISLTFYYCSRRYLANRQSISATSNTSRELGSALAIQIIHQGEALVNSYPVLLYSQAKQHKPDHSATIAPCCSICLADYKDTDWLRLLPDCGHLFHRDCVDMWLRRNLSCPVCRNSPLPTPISTPLAEVAPLATRRD